MLRIGIVAGEASGDNLGADLINQIKSIHPDVIFTGIGGNRMLQAGCECIHSIDELSVMGISEVFASLPRLLKTRHGLLEYYRKNPPDAFIGIDSPDFNFPLEKKLRRSGVKTIHYISPSVWAWREYRLKSIARAVDLMLVLFPFEENYYDRHGINARFVGHPLAGRLIDEISMPDARSKLGLPRDSKVITLMPGSRRSELRQLVKPFIHTAQWCLQQRQDLLFISNLNSDSDREYVQSVLQEEAPQVHIRFFTGQSLLAMAAADAILLASGTVALEALLVHRPMVVAYRVNTLTYHLVKRLIKLPWVSLPNILAGEKIVPECLQSACNAETMGTHLLHWLDDEQAVSALVNRFTQIHRQILPHAGYNAANAVLDMIHAG